jgi:hypothetical protein
VTLALFRITGLLLLSTLAMPAATILNVRADATRPLEYGMLKPSTLLAIQGTATNGTIGNTNTGLFSLQISPNSNFIPAESIWAYCAEPPQSISSSNLPNVFSSATLAEAGLSATQQSLMMALWHNAFHISVADSSPEGTAAVRAAAFQWLVWEILVDGNSGALNMTAGSVRISATATGNTATVRTLANAWATNLNNGTWAPVLRNLRILQHATIQDLIYEEAPEPPTIALVGFVLTAFSFGWRKRLQRTGQA